jgi:DUF4097 and DUF4098 domain-containing protein YvlB
MFIAILTAAVVAAPTAQQIDTVIPVREGARISVHALSGNVTVRTWDRSEVRVVADPSRGDEVTVRGRGSAVRVEANTPFSMGDPIDIDITVPVSVDLEIDGAFVTADVEGVEGAVSVHTVNGSVRLVGGSGFVNLHSVQGDVVCEGVSGRIQVGSVNGVLRLARASGEIAAEAVNGSMELTGIDSDAVEATTVNGGIRYEGTIRDRGRYVFGTHHGDLTIAIPQGTDADVLVSTYSGEFESDFPITLTETRGRGERFGFTLGSGGARIELKSFGGTIRLTRP